MISCRVTISRSDLVKTILIVDDEPMMLKIAARALKDRYETVLASSGKEALELFLKSKPDLVISDLKMPEMSGYELQKLLGENGGGDVPVIFMSADESDEAESMGLGQGAADFIRKPVKADVLLERVGIVLERALWGDVSGNGTKEGMTEGEPSKESESGYKAEKAKLPDWILHAPLIDSHEGLTNSETADGYLSAINVFLEHIDENIDELERCFRDEDIENYTIRTHALKSTSRIIGAMILSTMAAALERAGVEKDIQYIKDEHEQFIAEYRKYQHLLQGQMAHETKTDISADELKDAFLALKEYVNAEDFSLVQGAVEYLQKYNLPPDKEKIISEIKQSLNRLDWDTIHGIIGI